MLTRSCALMPHMRPMLIDLSLLWLLMTMGLKFVYFKSKLCNLQIKFRFYCFIVKQSEFQGHLTFFTSLEGKKQKRIHNYVTLALVPALHAGHITVWEPTACTFKLHVIYLLKVVLYSRYHWTFYMTLTY